VHGNVDALSIAIFEGLFTYKGTFASYFKEGAKTKLLAGIEILV